MIEPCDSAPVWTRKRKYVNNYPNIRVKGKIPFGEVLFFNNLISHIGK